MRAQLCRLIVTLVRRHLPRCRAVCFELSNPSKKPITYAVRLEGAPCFRLPADSVLPSP